MPRILCFGAGGHAAVLVDGLLEMSRTTPLQVAGLVARDNSTADIFGVPLLGDDTDLPGIIGRTGATHFVIGIGMLRGGDSLRARVFATAVVSGLRPFTLRHPSAIISPRAEIDEGAAILAGAVIQPRVRIGQNAIINTRASIDHDSVIGAHSHIAPGATLSGDVRVGEMVHIGTGAVVRNGMTIGASATIGVGAVLVSHCPEGATMVGIPARTTGASR